MVDFTSLSGARTLVQCDFDGTVTLEDASFIMLDRFARGDWHAINREYEAGRMTVGEFNDKAFGLVRATKATLLQAIEGKVHLRYGFSQFVAFCGERGIRLVIVSNGLEFYIQDILQREDIGGIEIHAARTEFRGDVVKVQYHGPDGNPVDDAFKSRYVSHFLSCGYRVFYLGDGSSDFAPAQKSQLIFATGTLRQKCIASGVGHFPFDDFFDVIKVIEGRAN